MRRIFTWGAFVVLGWMLGAFTFFFAVTFRWPFGSTPPLPRSRLSTVSPDTADFRFMGVGATRAIVWGDADRGPYGAYTKFAPGFAAPLHYHSSDMNFMVLQGAYLYKSERGEVKRIEAGSYIFIPACEPHWCSGDEKEGVLFYDVSPGRFDVVLGKKN